MTRQQKGSRGVDPRHISAPGLGPILDGAIAKILHAWARGSGDTGHSGKGSRSDKEVTVLV